VRILCSGVSANGCLGNQQQQPGLFGQRHWVWL
jgi:hypothetical protein